MLSVEIDVPVRKDASGGSRRAIKRYIQDGATKGQNVAHEEAPEDRGKLKQSRVDPQWNNGVLSWGYDAPYAEAQERGTDPFWAPIKPLVEWAERVAGDPSLGYYVQWKIAQEGVEAKEFMAKGVDAQVRWYKSNRFQDYLDDEL